MTAKKIITLFGQKIEVEVQTMTLFGQKIEVEVQVVAPPQPVLPFFMVKKTLTASDCSTMQGRFLIPNYTQHYTQLFDCLTSSEKEILKGSNPKIPLAAYDSRGAQYALYMSCWRSVKNLVINKGWASVVKANSLVKSDQVQLWFYRHQGSLCVLMKFDKGGASQTQNPN